MVAKNRTNWYDMRIMKKDIHPKAYRAVVFEDISSHTQFIIGSTIDSTETATVSGKEYPKVIVEISSQSHPFYTGNDRILDKTGRVERFKQRASRRK